MLSNSEANFSSKHSINDIKLASGPTAGVSFDGGLVKISESLCADIANGESETIVVTYSIVGIWGLEIPKIAIFNLSTSNDGLEVTGHLESKPFLKNGAFCFDLHSDNFARAS